MRLRWAALRVDLHRLSLAVTVGSARLGLFGHWLFALAAMLLVAAPVLVLGAHGAPAALAASVILWNPTSRAVFALMGVYNIVLYGADKTAGSDSTAAIQATAAAMPASGGILDVPAGDFRFSGTLNFDDKRSIIIRGTGGMSAGAAQASRLVYTANGTTTPISARSTLGFVMRDVAVVLVGGSTFSGNMVDFSWSASNTDTQLAVVERCFLGGNSVRTAASIINLDKALNVTIRDCNIVGSQVGVYGKASNGSYSNGNRIENCRFDLQEVNHIRNGGQAWVVSGCVFESLVTSGGANAGAGAFGRAAGVTQNDITFMGCWFGDATTAGTWIDFGGNGLNVIGCYISAGAVGVATGNASRAVHITGNEFVNTTTGISLGTTNIRLLIAGNEYGGVTTAIATTDTPQGVIQVTTPENLTGLYGGARIDRAAAADNALRVFVTGETNARVLFTAAGALKIGGGAAGTDLTLQRAATPTPTWQVLNGFTLMSFTTAGRPAAGNVTAGTMIYVSDAAAGSKLQYSDGAAWVAAG